MILLLEYGHARFTTVPLKPLQLPINDVEDNIIFLAGKVFNSDNFLSIVPSEEMLKSLLQRYLKSQSKIMKCLKRHLWIFLSFLIRQSFMMKSHSNYGFSLKVILGYIPLPNRVRIKSTKFSTLLFK